MIPVFENGYNIYKCLNTGISHLQNNYLAVNAFAHL